MTRRYRKKPVEVEAYEWTGQLSRYWPAWLLEYRGPTGADVRLCQDDKLRIPTLEGEMTADLGDFIIHGVVGEVYPCKPAIFHATYEPVDDGTS